MQKTNIAWTDYTSNPIKYRDKAGKVVWGCVKVSSGCASCYAESLALRFDRGKLFNAANMEELTPFLDEAELYKMLIYKPAKGKRTFVCDMTDAFGPWIPDELLDSLFAVMTMRQDVTWQLLTKRPERMQQYFSVADRHNTLELAADALLPGQGPEAFGGKHMLPSLPFPNVHLGVSCENQPTADERIPHLLRTPAAVRFLSVEPLLSVINLSNYIGNYPLHENKASGRDGLCGGQSRMVSDSCGRIRLEDGAATGKSLEQSNNSDAIGGSASNRCTSRGGLSNNPCDGGQDPVQLPCPSVGLDSLQRPDTIGQANQPQERGQGRQQAGESGTSDSIGEHSSRNKSLESGASGESGRAKKSRSEIERSSSGGHKDRLCQRKNDAEIAGSGVRSNPSDDIQTGSGRQPSEASRAYGGLHQQQDEKNKALKQQGAISLVIIGCESLGPRAGRFQDGYEAAARSLIQQCQAAGVPVFHKQMPIAGRVSHDPSEWPKDVRCQEFPGVEVVS